MRRSVVLTILIVIGSLGPSAESRPDSLPFRLLGLGDILVPVTIDGQGPFRFVLDTGSSRSAIAHDLAERFGLKANGRTLMVTPTGRIHRLTAEVARIGLGSPPPATVHALVLTRRELGHDGSVDGLIGQDILSGRAYTIDYEKRRIIWRSPLAPDPAGARLDLEMSEGRVLVSLPGQQCPIGRSSTLFADRACAALQLIPDSGADGVVLFVRPGRRLPSVTPLDTAALRTLSGQQVVRRVLIDSLDLGAFSLQNQTAVIVERPEADAPDGDGLLPLHLFARVTFNGPRGYLILEKR